MDNKEQKQPDFFCYKKLVVFGNSKVGKSALIQLLENDTFLTEKTNDCKKHKTIINNK